VGIVNKLIGVLMSGVMLIGVAASTVEATPSRSPEYGAKQEFQLAKADFLANKLLFLNEKHEFLETKAEYKAGNISKSEFVEAKINFVGSQIDFSNAKSDWLGVKQEYRGGGTTAVPIPATFLLFGGGFAGFVAWRWKADRNSRIEPRA
jgi:hypothetical protein